MISIIRIALILVLLTILAISIENVSAQEISSYPVLTDVGAKEMAMTYSFYMGQLFSIQKISTDFPEFSNIIKSHQIEFDQHFKSAVDNIDKTLKSTHTQWSNSKTTLLISLKNEINETNISRNDALDFIEIIKDRSDGNLPSPILETLLIHNPNFIRRPALEFVEGYRQVYSTENHLKSKGVNFQIEVPISWKIRDGVRPNVIALFNSENGRGFETATILIREIDTPIGVSAQLSDDDINNIFHEDSVLQLLPSGSKFISSERIVLDGLPGVAVIFDLQRSQLDMEFDIRNLTNIVLYQNKLIFIQFAVAVESDNTNQLNGRFEIFHSLFKHIGNSFVVQSQW